MTNFEKVKNWMQVSGSHVPTELGDVDEATAALRLHLIDEEHRELIYAMAYEDLLQVAKEIADLLFVVYGAAVNYGIPIDEVFDAVYESNMSKMPPDGVVKYREDGKILKGDWYQEPNIGAILYGLNEDPPEHAGKTIEARRFE